MTMAHNKNNVFVISPCYNEEACIASTMKLLRKTCPECVIVAVNDGSSDQTLTRLQELDDPGLVILDLPMNSGIGTAVQTGLRYAVRHGAEYAVKFDSDGQHPADPIEALLEPLRRNEADMTTGSRFLAGSTGFRSTFLRRQGIMIFRILSFLLTGQGLTDATSGFRAYNRSALEFAAENYPAFDYPEPEESILFFRNGFRVKEIPCCMLERQGGHSSIRPLKAVYYMVKVAISMIMAAMRGRKRRVGK